MTTFWLTLIIPVRFKDLEQAAFFETVLQSIEEVTGLQETTKVLVVDNHPIPNTALQEVIKRHSKIHLTYTHESRPGAGQARNHGVAIADTPWVAFIDADETLPPHWLSVYHSTLAKQGWKENLVLYGACYPDFPLIPRWLSDDLEWLFGGTRRTQHSSSRATRPVRQLFAGNFLMQRQAFLKEGGFLPVLPRGEDSELGLRLECLGYRGIFLPTAFVIHHIEASRLTPKAIGRLQYQMEVFKAFILLYHFYQTPSLRARLSLWKQQLRRWPSKIKNTWHRPGLSLLQRFVSTWVWLHGVVGVSHALLWKYRYWIPTMMFYKRHRCLEKEDA